MLSILTAYSEKNKFVDTINSQIEDDIAVYRIQSNTLLSRMLADNSVSDDSSIKYCNVFKVSKQNNLSSDTTVYFQYYEN